MSGNVVIIGGGQAAASASLRLRAGGYTGGIDIMSEERVPPYQRPPLSKKYLKGEMARDRLFLRPQDMYQQQGIELHLETQALYINRATKRVATDKNGNVSYDKLILATGATPRRLPAEVGGDLENVHTFRSMADADLLMDKMRPGQRLLVVGGGYIGLEMAAVGVGMGLEVSLIETAPRILNRVAAKETSAWFRDLHLGHGVDLREGVGLARLIGTGKLAEMAVLSDGSGLGVDLVVVGIGVTPNDALARSTGLSVSNGIATDACCRTFDPDIYAIGDCAVFPYQGVQTRLESVQNACDQGEYVADHILGTAPEAYVPVPWFWSDQYDVSLKIAGLNRGYDAVVPRPGEREGTVSNWYFAEGRFLAVDAINDPKAYMIGRRWLSAQLTPNTRQLADPSVSLKDIETQAPTG